MERVTDRKQIYYIINHYIDTWQLLNKLGISVRSNNSMFCPFHDNQNTPAAHLYKEDDGEYTIYCYSEDRLFHNTDLYKTYMPEINLEDLANLLYSRLPEQERLRIDDNVNKTYELPELPYENALRDFKEGKIEYNTLLGTINNLTPMDDTKRLLNMIYNIGDKDVNIPVNNKYVYYMKNYESDYRFISASKLLINYSNTLPTYLKDYLRISGDSIMLPNIINGMVHSITFRNLNGNKQFIKMGSISHIFYNLGHIPNTFKYGTPILLVEGNMDCDSIRRIYPYSLATLTNSLSLNQIQVLSYLTNKIIIAYDNDDAGDKGYWSAYNSLTKLGFTVKRFKHNQNLKDFGDLVDLEMKDKEEYDYICRAYKLQLDNFNF